MQDASISRPTPLGLHRVGGALALLLAVAAFRPAVAQQPVPASPYVGNQADSAGCLWVEAEYLLWWLRGDRLPPLVTGGPPGVAALPGDVLFGGSQVNDGARSGGRITAGFWFDDEQTLGVEASFFFLEGETAQAGFASGGDPVLARPFTSAITGRPAAELVAAPGVLAGGVTASEVSRGLLGAGVLLRTNLCCGCNWRVDALAGYRHLQFSDRVAVREDLVSLDPNNPDLVPAGTRFQVQDTFGTANQFHGFDAGLAGEVCFGAASFGVLGKLAVGGNGQTADVAGSTSVAVPGMPPVTNPGGLLALSSNSGRFSRGRVSLVPELGVKAGYQLTPGWRVGVGYTLLYWSNVVRAGDQIDTVVNPNLLPPSTGVGPQRPAPPFRGADLLVQGVNVGLEFRY